MYSEKDFQTLTDIFLANVPGLKALFLFGSYAAGTASEDSDMDIAALTERPVQREEKINILGRLWQILGPMGYRTDIIFKAAEQFDIDKNYPVTISYKINREGRLLWTK